MAKEKRIVKIHTKELQELLGTKSFVVDNDKYIETKKRNK